MKKQLFGMVAATVLATGAQAEGQGRVVLGVIIGFTGPIESLTPQMADGAELAMTEVTASGNLMGGMSVTSVRADSTCIDSAAAQAAAERLITADNVDGIVGADCSGVTTSILSNVAVPNGMVMVSPSATSPALSNIEDNGLFFRTAPSDARQGVVMAEVIMDRGLNEVAVTYTNNDYGQGLADSFTAAFEAAGGTVTIAVAHEDGRADYAAEVGALAAAGGEALVVAGYADQGGAGVIRAALDTGAFETFVLPDGMASQTLVDNFGADVNGSFGQQPGSDSKGAEIFHGLAEGAGFDGTSIFAKESYDAAALILLAMQAAGSTAPGDYAGHIMAVANAPGTPILPGQLGMALEMIANGQDIDYVGASAVELVGPGESAGAYREIEIEDGAFVTTRFR